MLNRTLLALGCAAALAAPAFAQSEVSTGDRSALSPLSALDEVAERVVAKVSPAVVLLEVEHTSYGPRRLTRGERAGLGVTGRYDERYFTRPEGPASGVVVGADRASSSSSTTVITSGTTSRAYNTNDIAARAAVDANVLVFRSPRRPPRNRNMTR